MTGATVPATIPPSSHHHPGTNRTHRRARVVARVATRQRVAEGETGVNFQTVLQDEANDAYADKYDAAIVFANVQEFAQEATVRIHWSTPMAAETPWYVHEVPTVFVSLTQPNHLIDVPMVKTMIHAHAPSREAIHAASEKIQGKSPFQGTFNENVFCDTFGTRL